MFELSLVELLFIAVVALLVIGPQDLPKALGAIIKLFKQLQTVISEVRSSVDELVDEAGIRDATDELKKDAKYIIDQNGEYQEIYDVSDFLDEEQKPKLSPSKPDAPHE